MGSELIAQMLHIEPPHAFQTVICIRLYHHSSVTQSSMAITGYVGFIAFSKASIALMSCPKSTPLVCKHDKRSQTAEYVN